MGSETLWDAEKRGVDPRPRGRLLWDGTAYKRKEDSMTTVLRRERGGAETWSRPPGAGC